MSRSEFDRLYALVTGKASPAYDNEIDELTDKAEKFIETIADDRTRDYVRLRYICGYTYSEICDECDEFGELGLDEDCVRKRVIRCIKKAEMPLKPKKPTTRVKKSKARNEADDVELNKAIKRADKEMLECALQSDKIRPVDVQNIKTLAEKLKALRVENNYSRMKLAKLLGVRQGKILRWETGEFPEADLVILKYAKIFDVSADDLLGIKRQKRS